MSRTSPNLLFVFADQMRAQAMGCVGNHQVRTPHLDELAEGGVLFTRAYSANPVCSPCRASMITGRFPHSTGVIKNNIRLPEKEISIAEVLKNNGYKTGYIGKWHLDGPAYPGFVPPGPRRQGFDFWAGFNRGHQYWSPVYYRDTDEPIKVDAYEPDYQTDMAIEFMEQNGSDPFFLFLAWGPPHTPLHPPQKSAEMYDPERIRLRPNVPEEEHERARSEIAAYYGLITSLDANLGRLLEVLERLNLAENTVVCFTSDHGDMLGSHGLYRKGFPFDESSRIPFILRYPRLLDAGGIVDFPVSTVDMMPTLLSLCEIACPPKVQGADIFEVIASRAASELKPVYMEGRMTSPAEWRAVLTDRYIFTVAWRDMKARYLFDLQKDPYQMNNLVGQLGSTKVVEGLQKILHWCMERTGDYRD